MQGRVGVFRVVAFRFLRAESEFRGVSRLVTGPTTLTGILLWAAVPPQAATGGQRFFSSFSSFLSLLFSLFFSLSSFLSLLFSFSSFSFLFLGFLEWASPARNPGVRIHCPEFGIHPGPAPEYKEGNHSGPAPEYKEGNHSSYARDILQKRPSGGGFG